MFALRQFQLFRRDPVPPLPLIKVSGRGAAAAFRAAVEQRLLVLEREMGELKGRLNGLIFLVIGTVITQVTLKLVE